MNHSMVQRVPKIFKTARDVRWHVPMGSVASEVELAWQAKRKIGSVVAVGLVITGANHVGNISANGLYFIVEVIEDLIILCSFVVGVERGDISTSFLLDPRISVRDITDCEMLVD